MKRSPSRSKKVEVQDEPKTIVYGEAGPDTDFYFWLKDEGDVYEGPFKSKVKAKVKATAYAKAHGYKVEAF